MKTFNDLPTFLSEKQILLKTTSGKKSLHKSMILLRERG